MVTMERRGMRCCLMLLVAAALLTSAVADLDCVGAGVEIEAVFPKGPQAVYGYPALFGTLLNDTATPQLPLEEADPLNACSSVAPATQPGSVALVARGSCSFLEKARTLQDAGFSYMILYNTEPDCVLMSGAANASTGAELAIAAASVTQEAGQLLQQLAAQGGNVTLRAPDLPRIDLVPAAALWAMAVGTVVAGALWSAAELRHRMTAAVLPLDQAHATKGAGEEDLEVTVITSKGALLFIVVASAMLLLMFLLVNSTWFVLVMVVLFALGSWQTLGLVLLVGLAKLLPRSWVAAHITLPRLGPAPALSLAANTVAAAASITWFVFRHSHWAWALQDVLGISLMLVILQQLRLPNLKVASILLPLAFFYDIWWVFLQPLVTGGDSVMIAVARGGQVEQLPMLLEVPRKALGGGVAYSMLGFGDVILPGLLVVFASRFDTAFRLSWHRGYFVPVSVGYGTGLVLTYLALAFSIGGSQGQPALLYLVPCTLGCVALLAWWRGQFLELWHCDIEGSEHGDRRHPDEEASAEAGLGNERRRLLSSPPRSPQLPSS